VKYPATTTNNTPEAPTGSAAPEAPTGSAAVRQDDFNAAPLKSSDDDDESSNAMPFDRSI